MALTLHTIDSLDQLVALNNEWADLLKRSITNTTFQTPAFVLSWLKTLGQKSQPQVVVWRDESNQLVGLAPLCLTENNEIEFIGGKDVSDYLDFLIDPSHKIEIYHQIGLLLFDHPATKTNLHSIPGLSPTLKFLPDIWSELTSNSSSPSLEIQDVCPIITLPQTWDEYLSQLDRKQRHEIRRKWKKLESLAEVEFTVVTQTQDLEWAVDEFVRLHKLSSQDKAKFWIPSMADFFHEFMLALAQQNQLRLTFLKLKNLSVETELDNPINPWVAAMLGFVSYDRYLLYNSGFDPAYATLSTGQVLTAYTIKWAIENRLTHYDFMRGREEYKFRLGGQPTEVFDLTLSR